MPLRFLFYLGHPAHYHNVKHSICSLQDLGHVVKVVARGKDVLFDLVDTENWDLVKLPERKPSGKMGLIAAILRREWTMWRIACRFRPDLMVGTDLVIAHIGKLLGFPSVIVNEDDSAAIPLMAKYGFPYATAILAPNCCDQHPANHKKIGYEGYHELAYLHPNVFTPLRDRLPPALREADRYFILRFASLHAHHDAGRQGIDDDLALKLIEVLSPFGKVAITSERPFAKRLEPYRLHIAPADMHHAMAFASLYIGDSQTMAAEAAVLGIPSIRFNDFVGQLNYLEELETTYGLTQGITTDRPEELLSLAASWASDTTLAAEWQRKRHKMLEATIDVTPFWVSTFLHLAAKKR